MSIKELAIKIAGEFNDDIKEAGCTTFKEMKSLYGWDSSDIRSEIEYMVNRMDWGEGVTSGCCFFDNVICNVSNSKDPDDEISYRDFKKLVFMNVK